MKLRFDGVTWGKPYPWHYFYWWNWLKPDQRYWGWYATYYDGAHVSFGFWFFNWSWSTPWWDGRYDETKWPFKNK